ncbi:hypothetical protein [Dysgonomonas massiliensis]|nr:hypothetical protein [Dysgonomonas massiliensis]
MTRSIQMENLPVCMRTTIDKVEYSQEKEFLLLFETMQTYKETLLNG